MKWFLLGYAVHIWVDALLTWAGKLHRTAHRDGDASP